MGGDAALIAIDTSLLPCLQAAERLSVVGPRVFDLQIGLLCRDAGVTEVWTHDAGFVALPGLKVVDPLSASPPRRYRSRP